MRYKEHNAVRVMHITEGHKIEPVLLAESISLYMGIDRPKIQIVLRECLIDLCRTRVSDIGAVLLERHAHEVDACLRKIHLRTHEFTHNHLCNIATHAIVDTSSRRNQLRVIAKALRLIDEVIRIDPDAVATDQPRLEAERIPLRIHRSNNLVRVDIHAMKDHGKLIHKSNVDIALRILRDLCCLCHANRGGAIDTLYNRPVDIGDIIQRFLVHARYDLYNIVQTVHAIPRIDSLRRISYAEIHARTQPRDLLEQRCADILRHPRIDR